MKQYKNALLLSGFILFCLFLQAQNQKGLTISAGTGLFSSPYYSDYKPGQFYTVDFDYQLSGKGSLSINFFGGTHRYTEDIGNPPLSYHYDDGTNANVDYKFYSILYKHRLAEGKRFLLQAGAGLGIMTLTREFPFYDSPSSIYPRQSIFSDVAFPIRLELFYKISSKLRTGLIGGTFIEPDYPALAYHAGLQIGYTIK